MFATIVNCVAVLVGALLGLLIGQRISESYKRVVFDGIGIITLVIGLSMALPSQRIVYLALSLIIGGLLGTAWDVDGAILRLGQHLEKWTLKRNRSGDGALSSEGASAEGSKDFGHAFLNASVLFCVGAMALVGSFKAGTEGDYTLILTKSVMDGFMAILMTAALGIGVAFSALPILVYQGLLTLLAGSVKPFVSPLMLSELSGVGGAMVMMIGFNLLSLKTIKTANFLPALLVIVGLVLLDPLVIQFAHLVGIG
ncbi:MAG: DUF554 domain-containing protein [Breznakiellaceae bacterium]